MNFCRVCVYTFFLVLMSQALPALANIRLSNPQPMQGETIEVTWEPGKGDDSHVVSDYKTNPLTSIAFNGNNYKLFSTATDASQYHCLIAIPADLIPGKYLLGPIVARANMIADKNPLVVSKEQIELTVKDAKFPVQHIHLPNAKNNFVMSPGEEQAMDSAKAILSSDRLWKGIFVKPCQAKLSARFGIKRVVNGKLLKDYYHSGIDFAGTMGQPVAACADGNVVLAHRNFKLHGNVIALDHGQGVVTIYIHLQKILVKKGDYVHAGDEIGKVGMTGRANGPHLHLSLYVNQIAANPLPWFKKTF